MLNSLYYLAPPKIFTLMMTDTFSRNVGKVFLISKLVSENSLFIYVGAN